MMRSKENFNVEFGVAICESVEGDHVFVTNVVAKCVDATAKLRRVRAAGGSNLEPLAMDAANAFHDLIVAILDEVNPRLEERGL
jgi:hypothetical protein